MRKIYVLAILLFFVYSLSFAQTWRRVGGWGNDFTGVSWVNDEVGYISGDQVILKTVDGGLSWSEQEAPTKNKMNGIDFFNENVGLIVGENGEVYRTTNSGESWNLISINTSRSLKKVKFLNQNRAYIVGDGGELYRSTNGGQSWARQNVGTTADLTGLTFVNIDTG